LYFCFIAAAVMTLF